MTTDPVFFSNEIIEGEACFSHKVQRHHPQSRGAIEALNEADRRVEIGQGTAYKWPLLTGHLEAGVLNTDDDALPSRQAVRAVTRRLPADPRGYSHPAKSRSSGFTT